MSESIIATIFSYLLFASFILLLIISSYSISFIKEDVMLADFTLREDILYGFGIAFSVILFIAAFGYCASPFNILNYILTFALTATFLIIYIVTHTSSQATMYTNRISKVWDDSLSFQKLQIKYKCCGWYNSTDRGIPGCPIEYDSGCYSQFQDLISRYFNEIFYPSIVVLCIFVTSIVVIDIILCVEDEDEVFDVMPF